MEAEAESLDSGTSQSSTVGHCRLLLIQARRLKVDDDLSITSVHKLLQSMIGPKLEQRQKPKGFYCFLFYETETAGLFKRCLIRLQLHHVIMVVLELGKHQDLNIIRWYSAGLMIYYIIDTESTFVSSPISCCSSQSSILKTVVSWRIWPQEPGNHMK